MDKTFTKITHEVERRLRVPLTVSGTDNSAATGEIITEVVLEKLRVDLSDINLILKDKYREEDQPPAADLGLSMEETLSSIKPCPACKSSLVGVSIGKLKNCSCTRCGEQTKKDSVSMEKAISLWNDHEICGELTIYPEVPCE